MNLYSTRVETLPDIKRRLEELQSIQKIRVKTKTTSKVNIGDGTSTIIFGTVTKKYTGNIIMERFEDSFKIAVRSKGETLVVFPCDQIKSCSIIKTTVTVQFREDYHVEKCILEFFSEEQVQMFQYNLPPIKRPEGEDNVSDESSNSDFNDSGNEKTSGMNNSFDSTNLSEHG